MPSPQRRPSRLQKKFKKRLKPLDAEAKDTVLKTRGYTMLDPEKLYAFIQAIRYIEKHAIQGDIVECGVWRGGAVMAAALTLLQLEAKKRKFYLYDTFSGMTRPTEKDNAMPGAGGIDVPQKFKQHQTGEDSSDWCCASLDDVKKNLSTIPYDQDKFVLIEGKVEDTLTEVVPDTISILRLDTDWYESTKQEMLCLMPHLQPNGVLIIDDYYRWSGSKQAVDEYLDLHQIPILLTKVGSSAIGVRPV